MSELRAPLTVIAGVAETLEDVALAATEAHQGLGLSLARADRSCPRRDLEWRPTPGPGSDVALRLPREPPR